jgi:hypothetical protein
MVDGGKKNSDVNLRTFSNGPNSGFRTIRSIKKLPRPFFKSKKSVDIRNHTLKRGVRDHDARDAGPEGRFDCEHS